MTGRHIRPITDELFPDLARALMRYRDAGDGNPLHHFDGEHTLLNGSRVRFLPGAMMAVALYGNGIRDSAVAGETNHGKLYTFDAPTLFTPEHHIFDGVIPGRPHGLVTEEALGPVKGVSDLNWVMDDLYKRMGDLWTRRETMGLGSDEIAMVVAITIDDNLPPGIEAAHREKGAHIETYERGQVVLQPMRSRLFSRIMRPYLSVDPGG